MKNGKLKKFMFFITNPAFLLFYYFAWRSVYKICMFGRDRAAFRELIVCAAFFGCYFIFGLISLISNIKSNNNIKMDEAIKGLEENGNEITGEEESRIKKKFEKKEKIVSVYCIIGVCVLLGITGFYGGKTVKNTMNYNGKLSWYLQDLFKKKEIEYTHNNIYDDGINGLFRNIREKVEVPEDLYLTNDFIVKFDKDGTVTSVDAFVYGKNQKDELKTFLISYDKNKSSKIDVYLDNNANPTYSIDKKMEPLFKTMDMINVKDYVDKHNEENSFGILYRGNRSWGYDDSGIVYIDSEGKQYTYGEALERSKEKVDLTFNIDPNNDIIGYSVSEYVVDKENSCMPVRYNLVEWVRKLSNVEGAEGVQGSQGTEETKNNESSKGSEGTKTFKDNEDGSEEFYLTDKVGYKLNVTDAAAGSRAYSFSKTTNGGFSWNIVNGNAFGERLGVAAGIRFINEDLGFICLSHSGGEYAELYRTSDKGVTFTEVAIPSVEVNSEYDGKKIKPFKFPSMPYEEGGKLKMIVGQGASGDYKGGCVGFFESNDNGVTWSFIEEVQNIE